MGRLRQRGTHEIKAMFFDIDGTLVGMKDHRLHERTRAALLAARAKGIRLFAATGRHQCALAEGGWLEGLTFDGFVTLNGQYCFNEDAVIFANPIVREDIAHLLQYLEKNPFPCMFLEKDRMYLNFVNETVEYVHNAIGSPLPPLGDVARAAHNDIFQICLYTGKVDVDIMAELKHCTYTHWFSDGVDIIPMGGGKWVGIQRMLAHFGLAPEEAAAFGDGENDIEMLENVGTSFAVDGANAQVIAAADAVTGDLYEGGVGDAIFSLLAE